MSTDERLEMMRAAPLEQVTYHLLMSIALTTETASLPADADESVKEAAKDAVRRGIQDAAMTFGVWMTKLGGRADFIRVDLSRKPDQP